MADASTFDKIRIAIASPDQIRTWSYGEVKKPETINYRTFKPERDGLFCEKIFGPQKDWECHCGRYKKVKFKGIICDRCGVEVTRSKVRRERMGHIELASPVSHIWYLKGVPSPLALILDMTPRPLEKVLYFASYIVTSVDKGRILGNMDKFRDAIEQEIAAITDDRDDAIREYRDDFARETALGRVVAVEAPLEGEEEVEPERVPYTAEEVADREKMLSDRVRQEEKDADERAKELRDSLDLMKTLEKRMLLGEDDWRKIERLRDVVVARIDETLIDIVDAGLGGAAIKKLLLEVDLDALQRQLRKEIEETQGPKKLRAIKRIEVVNAFVDSKARPEWMILDAVPVISPELRPMVQLDGGRFATSDLNDLYRRIINRNNRLKKIQEIRAPESIVNHEKRLLQEAVDALIDNGRRTRPVTGSNGRPLKSLSDMLKGKEGRFRKNLLGKRVDYSGRSVIVVGPHLKLHECGLPKEMALELFKPFVMKTLVERQYTSNIKTAKRMIDKMRPEVWDALEEVIKEHPVLLNRAPTLHRLGIQAFEPRLVDGKAIQLHPLVCKAFNADFDGDPMAVHIPLSATAQAEARVLMLATHNLFSPADGSPIVSPQQDIVLGNYYLTMDKSDAVTAEGIVSYTGEKRILGDEDLGRVVVTSVIRVDTGEIVAEPGQPLRPEVIAELKANPEAFKPFTIGTKHRFASAEDAILAYESGQLDLHEYLTIRPREGEKPMAITAGRIIFNEIVPEVLRYKNEAFGKKQLTRLIAEVFASSGTEAVITFLDDMKAQGFKWAAKAGITFAMTDMQSPESRALILRETEEKVDNANKQYRRGMISPGERKQQVLKLWTDATAQIGDEIVKNISKFNPISIVTTSGARGSIKQVSQLSGMRGLMSDPFGNIIDSLPVKSNFHEGLSTLEYFVTTHGARKGLADTALRTADAGYLTRRLVDVAQDVIIREINCGTANGVYVETIREGGDVIELLSERLRGRTSLEDILHPETGEIIAKKEDVFSPELAKAVEAAGVTRVGLRSVLYCESRQGVCATCYGEDLATGKAVEIGVAVGIIAAQSIGEPGTQLTMRTFHTGGVASANQLTGVAGVRRQRSANLAFIYQDSQAGRLSLDQEEGNDREKQRQVQQLLKVAEEQVGGLLRVVELFEARNPKGEAIVTEFGGRVAEIKTEGLRKVYIHTRVKVGEDAKNIRNATSAEDLRDPVKDEIIVPAGGDITERLAKKIRDAGHETILVVKDKVVPYRGELEVHVGDEVEPGHRLTDGPLSPQKVLDLQHARGVQEYLVREVQRVYKQQGVDINDKHVEVIVRQMLKKRKIADPGDTDFLQGQVIDRFIIEDENRKIESRETVGKIATSVPVLLGITEASLATESFLSAASFQKTTRVLTEAAVRGKRDFLVGLKENVIIGRLIPAGTGLAQYRALDVVLPDGSPVQVEPQERKRVPLDLQEELSALDTYKQASSALMGAEETPSETPAL